MKLSEQGTTKVYVKISRTYPATNASLDKGMIGPTTSRGTRYIFAQSGKGRFEEVGQVSISTGELLDTTNYGPENSRDANIVISAILNS